MLEFFKKLLIFILFILMVSCNDNQKSVFYTLYNYAESDNYFKLDRAYTSKSKELNKRYQIFFEAIIANAFNRWEESNEKIELILKKDLGVADSLKKKLFEIKYDNYVKLNSYGEAAKIIQEIMLNYKNSLTDIEIKELRNSYKIFSALKKEEPQKTIFNSEKIIMSMEKDKANLNTLKVKSRQNEYNFIFDTGANFSTTSLSVARQMEMKIFPDLVEVGTITGKEINAQIALCKKIFLGDIEIKNVVFLVFPDDALKFESINYQIFGILGFPVIKALGEIQITNTGEFIVNNNDSYIEINNLAMKGLNPIIEIENKYFSLDTGADTTILYEKYYLENKDSINKYFKTQKVNFSGVGGSKEFEGYKINFNITYNQKKITLKDIFLLKEKISDAETLYGNIGQDFIRNFDTLTINFNKMFVSFH